MLEQVEIMNDRFVGWLFTAGLYFTWIYSTTIACHNVRSYSLEAFVKQYICLFYASTFLPPCLPKFIYLLCFDRGIYKVSKLYSHSNPWDHIYLWNSVWIVTYLSMLAHFAWVWPRTMNLNITHTSLLNHDCHRLWDGRK